MNDLLQKTKELEALHRKKLHPETKAVADKMQEVFGELSVKPIITEEERTELQNKALHVYFRLLATALNDAGWDMKKTLKPGIEIPWTEEMVKTHLWKPVQKVMLEKESTTKLNTKQVNQVYEVIDRHLSDKTGVHVEFPKDESKP